MKTHSKRLISLAVAAALGAPLAAHATNGMNLEAYGPIAGGMGGASMAYDNGTAAMMNNPATLGLAEDGNRLDVALGNLRPTVAASFGAMSWDSDATSFMMPAVGWSKKQGQMSYGFGVFAQGGMGTEYAGGVLSGMVAAGNAMGASAFGGTPNAATQATVSGWDEMSEVGVMRILVPLTYRLNDQVTVGGSLDYVRANMDLQMVMTGAMMWDMMPTMYNAGASQNGGTLSGTMIDTMMGFGLTDIYGAQFDFADSSPYTGKTSGSGFAFKLGATFELSDAVTVGATYHSKTSLSDLEGGAAANMAVGTGGGDMVMSLAGDVAIKDFEWPATMALGVAIQANDSLMIAADVKRIAWSDVMADFKMSFTAAGNGGMAAGFNGTTMDAVMYQNWDDQTVVQIGAAFKASEALTLRAGYNRASNPIPNTTLHYLFPATVENHLSLGMGYLVSDHQSVDFSLTKVPELATTNSLGMEITHSQLNWQFMYSHKF